MDALTEGAQIVNIDTVDPIPLPGGSWSSMILTSATVPVIGSALGYSVFRPGSVTGFVSHLVEEVAYVVEGSGELRQDTGAVPFHQGDALWVPAHTWHAVANTGETDVVMVFMFPHPAYPPTERR